MTSPPDPAPPTPRARVPLQVLVVDDDDVDREFVRRTLTRSELDVTVLEESDPAVALATVRRSEPDVVVLDYSFPRHDGLTVLHELHEIDPRLPVIVMTGRDGSELAVRLMKAGAVDYLPKSTITPERLAQSIRHALRLRASEIAARAAEEALRASEQFNRSILDASQDCIKVLDLDGNMLSMSPAGQRMLGVHDFGPLRGTSWLSFWQEEHLESARAALQSARDGGVGRFVGCAALGNGIAWFDVQLTAIHEASGPPLRLLAVSRDVTEQRKQLEFEQQLIGIVSHDLRNPVAAIVMGGNLLTKMLPEESPAGGIAQRVARSGARASRLIDDLLDFTQARLAGGLPIHATSADLHAICRQVVDELAISHPDRTLEHRCEGDGSGHWDPDRLAQVIGNLALNAISYSPPDTTVCVRTRGDAASVVLEVHNRGPAIAAAMLPILFEPFQRGDRKQGHERRIGLGLFIVRHIVAAHGGTVDVQSRDPDGTTFFVELPKHR